MQVRFDDTAADRDGLLKNLIFWSPLRVGSTGLLTGVFTYFYLGHDQFMYTMFGYESEALVESRVNTQPEHHWEETLGHLRGSNSNLRKFEVDQHPRERFPGVFKKDAQGKPIIDVEARRSPWAERREVGVPTN